MCDDLNGASSRPHEFCSWLLRKDWTLFRCLQGGLANINKLFNPEVANLSGISSTDGLYVEDIVQLVTFMADSNYTEANFLTGEEKVELMKRAQRLQRKIWILIITYSEYL